MILRQVRKLGINALKPLASELGMSVCGSHSMRICSLAVLVKPHDFAPKVRKLGINALKALASELGMSVCGSHSMFCT